MKPLKFRSDVRIKELQAEVSILAVQLEATKKELRAEIALQRELWQEDNPEPYVRPKQNSGAKAKRLASLIWCLREQQRSWKQICTILNLPYSRVTMLWRTHMAHGWEVNLQLERDFGEIIRFAYMGYVERFLKETPEVLFPVVTAVKE